MSFKDIRGQERAIGILRGCISQGRLKGGYLFTGPRGVGKRLVAGTLAQTLNCAQGNNDPCGVCPSCKKIEAVQHPDVHIIEGREGQIKIESIRQLQREMGFRPYEAKTKVAIIDDAHNLTAEAQNALLKVLEEPPAESLIILLTDKPALLFKTILSRCKVLKFAPIRRKELETVLKDGYKLDNDTAHFLAYFCEGRLGEALGLKDKDILRHKNEVINGFFSLGRPKANSLNLHEKEKLKGYLNILASWFRDIYLLKAGIPDSEVIHLDRKAELLRNASGYTFIRLNEIFKAISDSIFYMERNINLKLLVHNIGAELWKG